MSNRRKDRPVPEGYRRYDGEYEKCWHTAYTFNGAYFHHCWPNAGMFHSESGQYIPGNQIFAIKPEIEKGSEL